MEKNNTFLRVLLAVTCIMVLVLFVILGLFATGVISVKGNDENKMMYLAEDSYMRSEGNDAGTVIIALKEGAAVVFHSSENSKYAFVTYVDDFASYNGFIKKSVLTEEKR